MGLPNLRYDEPMAPWGKRMCCCFRKRKRAALASFESKQAVISSSRALRAVGWTSVAVGVTALGLFVGRELRLRYKFKRRTPSDFFSHAGEELNAEFGMGI